MSRRPFSQRTRAGRVVVTASVCAVALTGTALGVTWAAVPDAGTGVFHGCRNKATGALRLVDPAVSGYLGHCVTAPGSAQELPITFNQKGRDGLTGPPGPDGAVGPQGAQGAQGASGAQGPQGSPGVDGAAGVDGPPGKDGADGHDGTPGPVGPAGPAGPSGAAGPAGETGPTGPAGSQGSVGPAGPPGPAGPVSTAVPLVAYRVTGDFLAHTDQVTLPPGTYIVSASCTGGGFTSLAARAGGRAVQGTITCDDVPRVLGDILGRDPSTGAPLLLPTQLIVVTGPVDISFRGPSTIFVFEPSGQI